MYDCVNSFVESGCLYWRHTQQATYGLQGELHRLHLLISDKVHIQQYVSTQTSTWKWSAKYHQILLSEYALRESPIYLRYP